MAQPHLEQVLTTLGLSADQVKALAELPADAADFKPDPYVAPVNATIETRVKNDPEFYKGINKDSIPKDFLKTVEQEQYGRAANIVRGTMLKAVGLTEAEFKDLGEDVKKIEVFTPAFVAKLNKGDISIKELQTKLLDANTQIEQLKGQEPELEKKYQGQYEAKVMDFELKGSALAHLASVQGLVAPPKVLLTDLTSTLKNQYAWVNVNGTVEPRQLKNPELNVMIDNGTKVLTLEMAVDAYVAKEKLVDTKKKLDKSEGSEHIDLTPEGGKLKMSKGVSSKIADRIAQDKKNAPSGK